MEASLSRARGVLDDATFDRLVRTHRVPLERYTRGLGASREDAEEIAATALLRAHQSPPVARVDEEWRAWLRTVARNLWIDAHRRGELRLVTTDDALDAVPSTSRSVDQIAATAEEARQICAAIALLPPAQRAAIYLREVRGLSYEEIAAELGMTLTAVTATLHRAREGVKQRRGGLRHALALCFAPFALMRQATRSLRFAGTSGAGAKVAVPVILLTSAGGVALVAQQTIATAPRRSAHTTARPTRTALPGQSIGHVMPAATVRRADASSPSPPPLTQHQTPSPPYPSRAHVMEHRATSTLSMPSTVAATTLSGVAGAPETATASRQTAATPAAPPGRSGKTARSQRARQTFPASRHSTAHANPPVRSSPANAASSRPKAPTKAGGTSTRSRTSGTAPRTPPDRSAATASRGRPSTAAPTGAPASGAATTAASTDTTLTGANTAQHPSIPATPATPVGVPSVGGDPSATSAPGLSSTTNVPATRIAPTP